MKKLAAEETIVAIPVVLNPVEVQAPPVAVEVEVRNVQVAVGVPHNM